MMTFDYAASAELFMPKRKRGARQPLSYRRFATAAEAIRFAVEEIPSIRGGRRATGPAQPSLPNGCSAVSRRSDELRRRHNLQRKSAPVSAPPGAPAWVQNS
jgi:hypothetical protein